MGNINFPPLTRCTIVYPGHSTCIPYSNYSCNPLDNGSVTHSLIFFPKKIHIGVKVGLGAISKQHVYNTIFSSTVCFNSYLDKISSQLSLFELCCLKGGILLFFVLCSYVLIRTLKAWVPLTYPTYISWKENHHKCSKVI